MGPLNAFTLCSVWRPVRAVRDHGLNQSQSGSSRTGYIQYISTLSYTCCCNWSAWYFPVTIFFSLFKTKLRAMSYFPKFYIPLQFAFSYICLKRFVSCSFFVQPPHFYFLPRLLHQHSQTHIVFSSVKSDFRVQSGHVPFHYPCLWSHMLWQAHVALPHRDAWTFTQHLSVTVFNHWNTLHSSQLSR